ncbi:MAG: sporulation protein YabP [Clostridia bacterium]|nr:sporulation protein YabP [Clostridia bacterium]
MAIQEERMMQSLPQNLSLEDRKHLSVTGVSDVDSFDEQSVTVYTQLGELSIRGTDLHINALNVETGELVVDGQIDALIYTREQPKSSGFFGRVFR